MSTIFFGTPPQDIRRPNATLKVYGTKSNIAPQIRGVYTVLHHLQFRFNTKGSRDLRIYYPRAPKLSRH